MAKAKRTEGAPSIPAKAEPKKTGRPTARSAKLADEICERLAQGQSLREICLADGIPHISTICRWLAEDAIFREQYARARDAQADFYAEEIIEISDDASNDWMERAGKDDSPGWVVNGEHIQRSKLRVDTRKWLMARMAPKKFGDRVEQVHSGNPDAPPVAINVQFVTPTVG